MNFADQLPPLPEPAITVRGYGPAFGTADGAGAFTAGQMREYATAALDKGRPQYDWSLLEATQKSLREHMAEIRTLRAALAQQPAQPPAVDMQMPLMPQHEPLDDNTADAFRMGQTGSPSTDAERRRFQAWMAGHCWACAPWNGTGYTQQTTRVLWAAWRDCAALQQSAQARQPLTDEQIDTEIAVHVDPVATYRKLQNFARAIEAAHGITPADKSQWRCSKCGTDRLKTACPHGHGAALTGQCPMLGIATQKGAQ